MTFYPRDLACLSIIILSLCDTTASVVGRLTGKFTPPLPFSGKIFGSNKSLAGTFGGILMGCLASVSLVSFLLISCLFVVEFFFFLQLEMKTTDVFSFSFRFRFLYLKIQSHHINNNSIYFGQK